ncbi:MAG: hypothetical protein VCA40_08455, partial [Roseibacillus sp.]
MPVWLQSDWGDFSADRARLQAVAAHIRDHGSVAGMEEAGLRRDWTRLRTRCTRGSGRRPSERQLPEGLVTLVRHLEKLPEGMAAYQEKVAKLKGSARDGADQRFLDGRWDFSAFSASEMQAISQSAAILSGG